MRRRYLRRRGLAEARQEFLSRAPHGPLRTEEVPVAAAAGRITVAPIVALQSAPHYHGAAMDG
ncbi:MAG: hypothetical protein ACREQ9_19305, partial [Candidatus Binatia bacterium]